MPVWGTIYRGSDGQYYGDVDLWKRFEPGIWIPCCWDEESGTEWVETEAGDLLVLIPTSRATIPYQVQIEQVAAGLSVTSATVSQDRL